VGVPGAAGLNVTMSPWKAAAVHCAEEGHATEERACFGSRVVGVGEPGAPGSNVNSWPVSSTATQGPPGGHAAASSVPPASTIASAGVPGDDGSNVSASPPKSNAVHSVLLSQEMPARSEFELVSTVTGVGGKPGFGG